MQCEWGGASTCTNTLPAQWAGSVSGGVHQVVLVVFRNSWREGGEAGREGRGREGGGWRGEVLWARPRDCTLSGLSSWNRRRRRGEDKCPDDEQEELPLWSAREPQRCKM